MGRRKPADVLTPLGTSLMLVGGVALLIVGSLLKSHFQFNASVCNTFGGPAASCAGNEGIFTIGQIGQFIGAIVAGLGLLGLILTLVERSQTAKPAGGNLAPPRHPIRTTPQRLVETNPAASTRIGKPSGLGSITNAMTDSTSVQTVTETGPLSDSAVAEGPSSHDGSSDVPREEIGKLPRVSGYAAFQKSIPRDTPSNGRNA